MASSEISNTFWVPLCLRRSILISFALLYAILAILLGILYHIFNKNQGLDVPNTALLYLCTYVPSAIFIIISGFWTLLESNLKLLAPWQAMANHPSQASRSLLRDYITENRFVTLYVALKDWDRDVFLVVLGTLCLNALIVLSTGLFRVQGVTITYPTFSLPLLTSFDAKENITLTSNGIVASYAIWKYGLPFPLGTSSNFAYPSVNNSRVPLGAKALFEVDAFFPESTCEVANASWTFGYVSIKSSNDGYAYTRNFEGAGAKIRATTADCKLEYAWTIPEKDKSESLHFHDLMEVVCRNAHDIAAVTKLAVLTGSMMVTDLDISQAKKNFENTSIELDNGANFSSMESKMVESIAACVFCTITPKLRRASLLVSKNTVLAELLPKNGEDILISGSHGKDIPYVIDKYFHIDSQWLTSHDD